MERQWLIDPEQFNPERDCMQRDRLQQTLLAIKNLYLEQKVKDGIPTGKHVLDLGCGSGVLTRMLRDAGAHVDAADIAGNALLKLKEHDLNDITAIQQGLPATTLKDDYYDLVICTEVIAYQAPETYRLCFAELSRLVKPDGYVVCSTAIDIDSEDALERFAALAETEFAFEKWVFNHHRLLIKIINFFDGPKNQVTKNKSKFATLLWRCISFGTNPIAKWFKENDRLMPKLERLSNFLWGQASISNALFIGKRRPLVFSLPEKELPIEAKKKHHVWE